jgi:hypothetical protein
MLKGQPFSSLGKHNTCHKDCSQGVDYLDTWIRQSCKTGQNCMNTYTTHNG